MTNDTVSLRFAEASYLVSEGFPCELTRGNDGKTVFTFYTSELLVTERIAFAAHSDIQSYLKGVYELQRMIRNFSDERNNTAETKKEN